jgi:hypothetical protein
MHIACLSMLEVVTVIGHGSPSPKTPVEIVDICTHLSYSIMAGAKLRTENEELGERGGDAEEKQLQ